jgi:predicted HicB family RNase H-like nuclease
MQTGTMTTSIMEATKMTAVLAYPGVVAEFVRFVVRLYPDLHGKLVKLAEREHRSLHSQIVYLLERAVADQP